MSLEDVKMFVWMNKRAKPLNSVACKVLDNLNRQNNEDDMKKSLELLPYLEIEKPFQPLILMYSNYGLNLLKNGYRGIKNENSKITQ